MKKMLIKSALAALVGVGLMAGGAIASPVINGTGLQDALDNVTVGGDSSVDVYNDMLDDTLDSYWNFTSSSGSFATIVIELAGYAGVNTFGLYDAASGASVELFAGGDGSGAKTTVAMAADGSIYVGGFTAAYDTGVDFLSDSFGFYLDSTGGANGGFFYSDTSMNTDGVDHMAAYQGNNTDYLQVGTWTSGTFVDTDYILAWEDLDANDVNPDYDYADFVVLVSDVQPVPEPATMLLFGTGLAGLAGYSRRRKK